MEKEDLKSTGKENKRANRPTHMKGSKTALAHSKSMIELEKKPQKPTKIRKVNAEARNDLELSDLADRVMEYHCLNKRNLESADEDSQEQADGHQLLCFQEAKGGKRMKSNRKASSKLKLMGFRSRRREVVVRCVDDNESMKMDPALRYLYLTGVRDEDNDTDDSIKEKGIERNLTGIKMALRSYRRKNREESDQCIGKKALKEDSGEESGSEERMKRLKQE